MKKTIALAIALIMALTLAACGGNNSTPGAGNTTPPANTPSGNNPTPAPAPTPTDNPQPSETPSGTEGTPGPTPSLTAEAGGIIQFGGYDWFVLDVQDGTALIISKDILDLRAYHADGGDITWEHSDIRQHLNGEFYNGFSESDKARIIETTVINDDNPEYGTPGGNDTKDRIFLLSIDEPNRYFTDFGMRIATDAEGVYRSWWLRSPGDKGGNAAFIYDMEGGVAARGRNVDFDSHGIRPAMWITL